MLWARPRKRSPMRALRSREAHQADAKPGLRDQNRSTVQAPATQIGERFIGTDEGI